MSASSAGLDASTSGSAPASSPASTAATPHVHEGDLSVPPHVHVRATPRERRLAELGVLLTVAIWSLNFVVVKAAIGVLGPLSFTALRYAVAATTLLLVLRWRQGGFHRPRGYGRQLFVMGRSGSGRTRSSGRWASRRSRRGTRR